MWVSLTHPKCKPCFIECNHFTEAYTEYCDLFYLKMVTVFDEPILTFAHSLCAVATRDVFTKFDYLQEQFT